MTRPVPPRVEVKCCRVLASLRGTPLDLSRGTRDSPSCEPVATRPMSVVAVETVVQCPPQAVFDFVARRHFDNHPKWDPDVVEMTQTSSGPVGVGTTARVIRRQGRQQVEGTATVTEFQPDRRAAWDVRFGPFRLDQRAEFYPQDGGSATRLRLTITTRAQGPVGLLLPLLRGRFRKTMGRSVRIIATLLEQPR